MATAVIPGIKSFEYSQRGDAKTQGNRYRVFNFIPSPSPRLRVENIQMILFRESL